MRKIIILMLSLLSFSTFATPIVVISYFDAFHNHPFNNSEEIALALKKEFKRNKSDIQIKLCGLSTVYDKAFHQLQRCIKKLKEPPTMVLSLGESKCNLKMEMVTRNFTNMFDADNMGVVKSTPVIIPEGPLYLGLRYPLPQMYCSLEKEARQEVVLSNDAGSFVCNNTAHQMSSRFPQLQYGLVHVPANTCDRLEEKNNKVKKLLKIMIEEAVRFLESEFILSPATPHSSNLVRLPTKQIGHSELETRYKDQDLCLNEFFHLTKSVNAAP